MAEQRNKRGEVFSETLTRIHHQHPSLRDVETDGWAGHGLSWIFSTSDDEFLGLFGRMIEDAWQAAKPHNRRTARPPLSWEEDGIDIKQVMHGILYPGYSTLPFPEALRVLAGTRSQQHLARKVGLSRQRVNRLLLGVSKPTGDDMEQIAEAFGKPHFYFREYRSVVLAAALIARFDSDPETSAELMRRVSA